MLTNSYCCIDTSSSDMRGVFYYMYMYMLILLPKLLLTRKFIAYSVFFIGGISIGKQHISSLTCTLYDYLYVNLFSCVGTLTRISLVDYCYTERVKGTYCFLFMSMPLTC